MHIRMLRSIGLVSSWLMICKLENMSAFTPRGLITTSSRFYRAPKHSFANAVYAKANPFIRLSVCLSVCPSVTLRYCVKTQRDAVFTIGQPNVSSFLAPRMVYGGPPSPGKIWLQLMGFPTSHQPMSYVTPNFPKMGFRYPNLSFFRRNFDQNH